MLHVYQILDVHLCTVIWSYCLRDKVNNNFKSSYILSNFAQLVKDGISRDLNTKRIDTSPTHKSDAKVFHITLYFITYAFAFDSKMFEWIILELADQLHMCNIENMPLTKSGNRADMLYCHTDQYIEDLT